MFIECVRLVAGRHTQMLLQKWFCFCCF